MRVYSAQNIYRATFPDEEAIARYWWSLPRGSILPLTNGDTYQMLFAGCPGGMAGPDVRAAVLCSLAPQPSFLHQEGIRGILHARKYVGDVEFHIRVSDWIAHQHQNDIRYNTVVLHVVLFCDDSIPTLRQDGVTVPVCALSDLPVLATTSTAESILLENKRWPCQRILPQMSVEARDTLLVNAGIRRFEQKMQAFVEQLYASDYTLSYDACLLPALAEGLGYGRDRDFFRAVGLRLVGQRASVPEPLGRVPAPSPLDAERLQSLRRLVERYSPDFWQKFYGIVSRDNSMHQILRTLRAFFVDVGVSLARADILIINVILPFAAAIALIERDPLLGERAVSLYKTHPGLPSNWITRMMSTQLELPAEPRGSCRQQGLQYIYQQTCREKCCAQCIIGCKSWN